MNSKYLKTAEFCRNNWKEETEHILRVADEVCENYFLFDMPWDMERTVEPVIFKDKIDWNYIPGDDREFTWQFNRHRYFIILGQAYQLTGDKKYVKNFVRLMKDWIENVPYNKTSKATMWRSLEVGLRGEYWTLAMELFDGAEELSEVKDLYIESLKLHGKILMETHSEWSVFGNWGAIQDHGMFDIAIALGDREMAETAIERIKKECVAQIMEDGFQREQSPMYHAEVLKSFLDFIIRARKNGFEVPEIIETQTYKMAMAELKWIKPDGHHPLMGDSDDTDIRDLLTQCAYVFSDSQMKYCAFDKIDFETVWLAGEESIEEYEKIEVKEPDFKSIELSDSGNYIMRSGFDNKAHYMHMINGFTGGGHGHSDKLHVDLSLYGEDVLIDAGRYTYVPNKARFALKAAYQHNAPTVSGKEYTVNQPKSGGWGYLKTAVSVKEPMIIADEYEIAAGGHLGYMKLFGGCFVQRKVIWLKPSVFIIVDDFDGKGLHTYSSHFHFPETGSLKISGNTAVYTGDKVKAEFYFTGAHGVNVKEQSSEISRYYNFKCKNPALEVKSRCFGRQSHITVISPDGLKVTPLKMECGDIAAKEPGAITGLNIQSGKDTYTVFLSHKEIMGTFKCKDFVGAGMINVFKNSKLLFRLR